VKPYRRKHLAATVMSRVLRWTKEILTIGSTAPELGRIVVAFVVGLVAFAVGSVAFVVGFVASAVGFAVFGQVAAAFGLRDLGHWPYSR